MQEVLEEPTPEDRHGALREAPLGAPDVVRLAEAVHAATPLEAADGGAAAAL